MDFQESSDSIINWGNLFLSSAIGSWPLPFNLGAVYYLLLGTTLDLSHELHIAFNAVRSILEMDYRLTGSVHRIHYFVRTPSGPEMSFDEYLPGAVKLSNMLWSNYSTSSWVWNIPAPDIQSRTWMAHQSNDCIATMVSFHPTKSVTLLSAMRVTFADTLNLT